MCVTSSVGIPALQRGRSGRIRRAERNQNHPDGSPCYFRYYLGWGAVILHSKETIPFEIRRLVVDMVSLWLAVSLTRQGSPFLHTRPECDLYRHAEGTARTGQRLGI